MAWLTRVTYVTLQPQFERTDPSAAARFLQSLVTHVDGPLGSIIWRLFYWSLRRHQDDINQTSASPQRGRSVVSGARRAERASEAGARGRINKIAGVLITAIPFGSAARRCSWENGIFCYQMTVRIEVLCAETLSFEYDRRCFSAGRDSLNQTCRLFAWISGNFGKN